MENPKCILIVLNTTERGGAETQALYLAKGLIEKGFQVHVLSFGSKKESYWENFKIAGAKLYLTGFNSKLVLPPFHSLKAFLIYLQYNFKLINIVRSINPDVIIPFTYFPNIILARCWRFTRAKALYWNQRDASLMFQGRPWEIKALKSCTAIISNSYEGELFLKDYINNSVKIIHNGVILPPKKASQSPAEKIRIIMVANLHDLKDHLTLLKAWKRVIRDNTNEEIELLLAGRDGNMALEVKQFISDNNLNETVVCLGEVYDVSTLLSTCHIGVFSSVKEGLPNGILECMAVNLPVVATKMNGSKEVLGDDYPFLADPYDEITFARMILELINDVNLRERIGLQNFERIEKHFGIDKMVEEYISMLNN